MHGREAVRFPRTAERTRMTLTPPRAAGFSLLELVIVLVILGLGTALTFPTVSRITTHSRVNQAAMVVAQDLSLALSAAARERKPIRIARGGWGVDHPERAGERQTALHALAVERRRVPAVVHRPLCFAPVSVSLAND